MEKRNLTAIKVYDIVDNVEVNQARQASQVNQALDLPDLPDLPALLLLHLLYLIYPINMLRLSVSEAAKFFGIEQKTIRRAIAAGELRYVVVRGRYKILFESLLEWSQKRPRVKNKLAQEGLGQYVGQWKIRNKLFSPNPKALDNVAQGFSPEHQT